ncbi:hypothetical protein QE374_002693 [Microbacterium sp. SORGH_AS428]|uniref:hypothetical protein n=1 Tax=Microbacterium sp. SORGH_AS_0428 TaxID=3041788 RepID=UPI002855D6D0|nr:hypothetical protein [Microbacterium sp. SORGH_AS_0428]MDR6200784.1 hypothetical protein [Microbacterium sp. SORGH_AS_0428]
MPSTSANMFDPTQLIGAALSQPAVSFVLALVLAGGIGLLAGERVGGTGRLPVVEPRSVRARYVPEQRAVGVVAVMLIVVFFADYVLRGYILTGVDRLHWWRFATPIACAAIGVGVLLALIVIRGTTPAEAAVVSVERRSWGSFSSRFALIGLGVIALILTATTVSAGIASSPNGRGQYTWLVIPVPNEGAIDPIRLPFYGWTYGVPVLVSLGALLAVAWFALDRNAARPYLRTETLVAERSARRETARNVTRVTAAAMLLTLAGAWRFVARAGSGSQLTVMGQNGDNPYEVTWRYAELAVVAGWGAPLLEIVGFTLLLLGAGAGLRRRRVTRSLTEADVLPATAEATR